MSITPCCSHSSLCRSIAASRRSAAAWYSVSCSVEVDMIDRIREMNERQASSLAARRPPATGAVLGARLRGLTCVASAAAALLAGCGQKGPLFLPSQAGTPAQAPASTASTPALAASATATP
ncbi:MAG: lipoprotein [Betaproteobacteria bacterium]